MFLVNTCLLLTFGCKSSKNVVTDTVYFNKVQVSYKYVRDSIYVDKYRDIYTKGDTVFVNVNTIQYKLKYINNSDTIHDTAYTAKYIDKIVVKEVKKYPLLPYEIGCAIIMLSILIFYIKKRLL
jgi:hypothetical protein